MKEIEINQPHKLVIGPDSLNQLIQNLSKKSDHRIFILTDPHVFSKIEAQFRELLAKGIQIKIHVCKGAEPSYSDINEILVSSRDHNTNYVVGIGGGSVLDLAKLTAALTYSTNQIDSYVGKGLIQSRSIRLVCMPTTSGAGSESSPNAILIDDADNSKKGIIDACLMPDEVYIDPKLIISLPADVTAFTGLDALTHCIEAFANKNAHPVVDMYALEGIRLISQNLGKAIANGSDLEARSKVALGAYYGGMCLGPVNTAAVHALAYPLGTKYKIAHGLSNALLLPFVLEFNMSAAEERYAEIGLAMGGNPNASKKDMALQAVDLIRKLIADCGMPARLSDLKIDQNDIPQMASEALLIQRLLVNNPREVQIADAIAIYQNAY